MMKKQAITILIICFIVGTIVGVILGLSSKKDTVWITDNEFLYDKAVAYIINEETTKGHDKDKENYKVFTDYKGFGIEEKNNKKYAYMWILEEAYYVENDEVKISSGSSMPYKFTFENNEVVNYETSKDGSYYAPSIREMFPDSIENEVISFSLDNTKLKKQVEEYYSYLKQENKQNTNGTSIIDYNKVTTIDIETSEFGAIENAGEKYTLTQEEMDIMFDIFKNIEFKKETCDGLPKYYIKFNSKEKENFRMFGLEIFESSYHITSSSGGEAISSDTQREQIDKIIDSHFKN